jgi:polar amino acid transport system substrate-binding protein
MRLKNKLCQVFVSVSVLLSISLSYASATTLQIATSEARRPSSIMSEKILSLAYAQLGITIHLVPVPAARALAMWKSNQLDGIALRVIDIGFADTFRVNIPIAYEDAVVFTNKKQFQVNGYASLKPYVVGYMAGVSYLEDRLKDIPQKDAAPSIESLFRKLDVGRTDLVVESRSSLCTAKSLGYEKISILEPSLEKRMGYHDLHLRHKALALALEQILSEMEKDGRIKKIQDEVARDFIQNCPR